MRVVLNLIPVCSGGGQQQALNFLEYLFSQDDIYLSKWLVLAGKGTVIESWLVKQGRIPFKIFRRGYFYRLIINPFPVRFAVKRFDCDVVYHYSSGWFWFNKPQVVRSVFSNLYYPEIDFWSKKSKIRYLKKRLIDYYRKLGTLVSDGIIFENKSMQRRAAEIFSYPPERTIYIKPSIAHAIAADNLRSFPVRNIYKDDDKEEFKCLYLSSWYENKNFQVLPEVAVELKKMNINVMFVLALSPDDANVKQELIDKVVAEEVEEYFELVGTIHPRDVEEIVKSCSCMVLLSKLECFSSNVVEAWTYRRPIIISNMEWASSECLDAAVYVDRNSPKDIAEKLVLLKENKDYYNKIVEKGDKRILHFNSLDGKAQDQINFLEYIFHAGKKS